MLTLAILHRTRCLTIPLKCSGFYPPIWRTSSNCFSTQILANKADEDNKCFFHVSRDATLKCNGAFAISSHVMKVLNSKVYDVVKETPLNHAKALSEKTGNNVFFKREDLLQVFSFKLRGAYNKMAHLTEEQKKCGVVACSAGNHAQGVAYSAKKLGIAAKIFMPVITPAIKIDNVRRLGAEVILCGNMFDETMEATKEYSRKEGKALIHPFDDPLVIAGQGTIGLELLKQIGSHQLEGVFVSCGGGGMLAGIGSFLKSVAPHVRIIGVEAADAPTMTQSLREGCVVELNSVGTFADGAAVKRAGDLTFDICKDVVDEMVLCSTAEICQAIKDVFTDVRVVLEPAGALAIAGMTKYLQAKGIRNKSFAAICSGANMDFNRLRFVSDRADTSEHLVSVLMPEKPGTFKAMYDLIYPRQVTEFAYRLSSAPQYSDSNASVLMSFRPHDGEDPKTAINALREAGYIVTDLNDNEMAKVHGRFMVGGVSEIASDEVLYRFEFPDKPGALHGFLHSLSGRWNVSLFHYRNHGSDVDRVLVGIQVPLETKYEFDQFLLNMGRLGYRYQDETLNDMYCKFPGTKKLTQVSAKNLASATVVA